MAARHAAAPLLCVKEWGALRNRRQVAFAVQRAVQRGALRAPREITAAAGRLVMAPGAWADDTAGGMVALQQAGAAVHWDAAELLALERELLKHAHQSAPPSCVTEMFASVFAASIVDIVRTEAARGLDLVGRVIKSGLLAQYGALPSLLMDVLEEDDVASEASPDTFTAIAGTVAAVVPYDAAVRTRLQALLYRVVVAGVADGSGAWMRVGRAGDRVRADLYHLVARAFSGSGVVLPQAAELLDAVGEYTYLPWVELVRLLWGVARIPREDGATAAVHADASPILTEIARRFAADDCAELPRVRALHLLHSMLLTGCTRDDVMHGVIARLGPSLEPYHHHQLVWLVTSLGGLPYTRKQETLRWVQRELLALGASRPWLRGFSARALVRILPTLLRSRLETATALFASVILERESWYADIRPKALAVFATALPGYSDVRVRKRLATGVLFRALTIEDWPNARAPTQVLVALCTLRLGLPRDLETLARRALAAPCSQDFRRTQQRLMALCVAKMHLDPTLLRGIQALET